MNPFPPKKNRLSFFISILSFLLTHRSFALSTDPNPYLRPTSFEVLQYLHQCVHRSMAMKESFGHGMIKELKTNCLGQPNEDRITDVRITDVNEEQQASKKMKSDLA